MLGIALKSFSSDEMFGLHCTWRAAQTPSLIDAASVSGAPVIFRARDVLA
jgi:hypothetical protein